MADIGNDENDGMPGRGAAGGVMPMTSESHVVRCGQCQRERVVAVSISPAVLPQHRGASRGLEILQRRASGDETLLTMMCGALAESFAENLERAAVDVVDRQGVWQVACRVPGDRDRYYSSDQARSQGENEVVAAEPCWRGNFAKPPKKQTGRLAVGSACVGSSRCSGSAWSLPPSAPRGSFRHDPRGSRRKSPCRRQRRRRSKRRQPRRESQ